MLSAALLQVVEHSLGLARRTVGGPLGTVGPIGAATANEAGTIVSQWLLQASDHLAEVAVSKNRSTFWHHANAIELRTARGLFAHVQRDPGYTKEEAEEDIKFIRQEIARACALWPSPNDLDSMRHRFHLIEMIDTQFDGTGADGMMSDVATLAAEANERLQLRAREIG